MTIDIRTACALAKGFNIKRGIAGEVAALTGAMVESWWVVEAWDVTGERLEMHRSRLTDSADEVPK